MAFHSAPLGIGLLEANGVGHLERLAAPGESDRYAFRWQMPFPATWRLTVQGKATGHISKSSILIEKAQSKPRLFYWSLPNL